MTKEIPLTRGMVALVDDEDYERVAALKWGAITGDMTHWYARHAWIRNGEWGNIHMHRFILDAPKGVYVDHINGNGLDNRRCNLRLATVSQNVRNTRRPRTKTDSYGVTTGFRGKGYRAFITANEERIDLGWYATEAQAARVYDAAVHLIGDEFHQRNFDHLFDDALDAASAILNGAPPPRQPHILTDEDVIAIRRRYQAGGVLTREIADEYGVSVAAVNQAINGYTFRHITDPAPLRTYKRRNAA